MGLPGGEKTESDLLLDLYDRLLYDSHTNIHRKMAQQEAYGSKAVFKGSLVKSGFFRNAIYSIK